MLSQGEYTKLNKAWQLLEWNRTTVPNQQSELQFYQRYTMWQIILLYYLYTQDTCFTMPDYYIKISRRIDQFGSCVLLLKNFKVDLDQLSLPRKFDFDIIPYRKIWFRFEPWPSFSINHHATILCTYGILSRFIHTKAAHGKRNLATVARIVERLPRCSRNSLFANKKTYANS